MIWLIIMGWFSYFGRVINLFLPLEYETNWIVASMNMFWVWWIIYLGSKENKKGSKQGLWAIYMYRSNGILPRDLFEKLYPRPGLSLVNVWCNAEKRFPSYNLICWSKKGYKWVYDRTSSSNSSQLPMKLAKIRLLLNYVKFVLETFRRAFDTIISPFD